MKKITVLTACIACFGLFGMAQLRENHDHRLDRNSSQNARYGLFSTLNKLMHFNYTPLTAEDAVKKSKLIVSGTIKSISDGRSILMSPSTNQTDYIYTIVAEVEVEEFLKGKADSTIYVEFLRGSSEEMDLNMLEPTDDRVIMFLMDANQAWDKKMTEFSNEGMGVPLGSELYCLVSTQGLLVEGAGAVVQPLAGTLYEQLFDPNEADLDKILKAIKKGRLEDAGGKLGSSFEREKERNAKALAALEKEKNKK